MTLWAGLGCAVKPNRGAGIWIMVWCRGVNGGWEAGLLVVQEFTYVSTGAGFRSLRRTGRGGASMSKGCVVGQLA